jgi:hypothetical protein
MRIRTIAILALAGTALLLAACQTNDGEPVESVFSSILKIAAADAADFDSFGLALAIDGSYALVGAPGADGSGGNQGAAYLFLQTQGAEPGWGQVKKLLPDDPAAGDLFGISVDISGDYAVVGAGSEDGAGTDLGAVYVFYRDQGGADNWGQIKKITAGDGEDGDGFGFAVALDGDVLIVGADGADGSGINQGTAYIFYRDRNGIDNWGQVAKVFSSQPADDNQFGFAVAVGGGVAAVGSPGEDGEGIECGVVYFFSRDQSGIDAWGLTASFSPSDTPDQTWLGTALATDGVTAVIGSPWDDGAGTSRGAVHVLGRDQGGPGNWGEVKKLFASDPGDGALFGYSVAFDGDYILAGAGWAKGGGTERGQAYLFARNEGGPDSWGEVQRMRATDGANEDWFGTSVDIDGLYLLVGASGEDGAGTDRGAAYVYKKI